MVLFETNDTVGQIIAAVDTVTGSQFITLLLLTTLLMLVYMSIATPFGWPIEFSIILIFPMHMALLSYVGNWFSVAGPFLIYIGILIAKNILRR